MTNTSLNKPLIVGIMRQGIPSLSFDAIRLSGCENVAMDSSYKCNINKGMSEELTFVSLSQSPKPEPGTYNIEFKLYGKSVVQPLDIYPITIQATYIYK